jgi:cytochrome c-type biogenesis protein CcmH/NrfF
MSRKELTLEQRLEVVKHLENGKSLREIAQIMVIKMGRTSLLNKVMDMDDELLEMKTVETKQTIISHNQTFLNQFNDILPTFIVNTNS